MDNSGLEYNHYINLSVQRPDISVIAHKGYAIP
jgi:hypothetical protein